MLPTLILASSEITLAGQWTLVSVDESKFRKDRGLSNAETTARLTVEKSGKFFLVIPIDDRRSAYVGFLKRNDKDVDVHVLGGAITESRPTAKAAAPWKGRVSNGRLVLTLPSGSSFTFRRVLKTHDKVTNETSEPTNNSGSAPRRPESPPPAEPGSAPK